MVIPFIRLSRKHISEGGEQVTFDCELPDTENEDPDAWISCGVVQAEAQAGLLTKLRIELSSAFLSQFDDEAYDTVELLEAVVLWVGWETSLVPSDIIRADVIEPHHEASYRYSVELNKILDAVRV